MKKCPLLTAVTSAAVVALAGMAAPTFASDTNDLTNSSPYFYTAARGADVVPGVGQKETTDSGINHLPAYYGNMMTNNTFRFVNINEQVFTMVGDGKHGFYRYQDNGTVREYLTDEAEAAQGGLAAPENPIELRDPREMDDFVADATRTELSTIVNDYTHFDLSAGFGAFNAPGTTGVGGYKSFTTGGIANDDDRVNFVDLPISHPKYEGKYDTHPAIDLAAYYCTMSAADFPGAAAAMKFAFSQPAANKVGPLGVRAGLDIRENYLNVLRLDLLPDANLWVNTQQSTNPLWQAVDTSRRSQTDAEIYLVERPFFNEEFLFIVAVFDDGRIGRSSQFSYVRPDGAYFKSLVKRIYSGERLTDEYGDEFEGQRIRFNTRLVEQPRFNVLSERSDGTLRRTRGRRAVTGTNLFGVHHPGGNSQAGVSLTNFDSACPAMGGDFGEDFWGSAWPTNYQEVTPLCDGVLIDIKLFANLDNEDWDTQSKNLASAGTTTGGVLPYINNPAQGLFASPTPVEGISPPQIVQGQYGNFTDPYLIRRGFTNHEAYDVKNPASGFVQSNEGDTTVYTVDLQYRSAPDQVAIVETLPAGEEQNETRKRDGQN
ncbi:MAG: hypothetical protein V7745_03475 [Pseudomonadales bacterium]